MDISAEPQLDPARAIPAPTAEGEQRERRAEKRTLRPGHGSRYRPRRARAIGEAALLLLLVGSGCGRGSRGDAPSASATPKAAQLVPSADPAAKLEELPPPELRCLARYYAGDPVRRDGAWLLVLPTGTSVPYDDGRAKTLDERLSSPDIEDVFVPRYLRGPLAPVTEKDFDPGRARLTPVLAATYGATAAIVQRSLAAVWLVSGNALVHRRVAEPLGRVASRLQGLVDRQPGLRELFDPLGGGFSWRPIAGESRLSGHSFGIAVDLNPKKGAYWRWQPAWKNQIPEAVVEAFESEGFIWGGRWYHFDTMHFEYRPELLDPRCYPR